MKYSSSDKQKKISQFFTPQNRVQKQDQNKEVIVTTTTVSENQYNKVQELIGKRVKVFWPLDQAWYQGQVVGTQGIRSQVLYDDGDLEWLELGKEQFEVIDDGEPSQVPDGTVPARGSNSMQFDEEQEQDFSFQQLDENQIQGMDICGNTPTASLKRKISDLNIVQTTSATTTDDCMTTPQLLCKKPKTTPTTPTPTTDGLENMFTPPPGAAEKLRNTIDFSTDTGMGQATSFEKRIEAKFTFLKPDMRMDDCKRTPDHPDYNPRTLYIPKSFYTENKISPGQQQWWELKKENMDSVLLFKMGKFYEMYEMDAEIGVEVLKLVYMKGEQPHAGFPEVSYHKMAEMLVMKGYRVVVVEQVETPEQLAKRNQQNKELKRKQEKIVRREAVAVLSKGVLMDAEMVSCRPDATYVVGIVQDGCGNIGVCAVDVASCHVLVGQFRDDELFATLRCHLTSLKPVEIVYPNGGLVSDTVKKAVKKHMMDDNIRINIVPREFWSAEKAQTVMGQYFVDSTQSVQDGEHSCDFEKLPGVIQELVRGYENKKCSWSVFGGVCKFLWECLLDKVVIPVARIEKLPVYGQETTPESSQNIINDMEEEEEKEEDVQKNQQQFMVLEGATLQNLEVLENSEGGMQGSLLSSVDFCCTPFGRRLLRSLLCKPLVDIKQIVERQDAVEDLLDTCIDAASIATNHLSKVSDVERGIARLVAQGKCGGGFGREASHVVLYEDVGKRRVKAVYTALKDLQGLFCAVQAFQPVYASIRSSLLKNLVTIGKGFPDIQQELDHMFQMANWEEAMKCGQVVPSVGMDKEYDDAVEQINHIENQLEDFLLQVQTIFKDKSEVRYVSWTKHSHLIEVPEKKEKYVPADYDLVHRRKGYKRYSCQELKFLTTQLGKAKELKDKALATILQRIIGEFSKRKDLWFGAISGAAWLDFLMSLARAALQGEGEMCRPNVVHSDKPFFKAKNLRHPAKIKTAGGGFIENDVALGGDQDPPIVVLTGPNMGGKSTLLRQVCLCTLVAQIGGWVCARECSLTPTDMMFARMGARDDILRGQSTFYVESHETAVMLNKATSKTILALDEFGRGTATLDGTALASAVLNHIIDNIGCRTMFATHYQGLATEFEKHKCVGAKYMDFRFLEGSQDDIVFKYKLVDGVCTQSFGPNVAKLAGLPESIIQRAKQIAKQGIVHFEKGSPMLETKHTFCEDTDFRMETELQKLLLV